MLQYKLYDKAGNKTKDLTTAFKIEIHDIENNKSVKISYWIKIPEGDSSIKLRNNYHVPGGMEVIVNTPQGEKKYTGGQMVPPEQLQNAREVKSGSSSSSQKQGQDQQQDSGGDSSESPPWSDISEEFKKVDISSDENINKAIYKLKDFCPCKIESSSKKILPSTKLGTMFTLANIANSVPFIKDILSTFAIYLSDEPYNKIFGNNFVREGVLSLESNYIKYYQKNLKPERSLSDVSTFMALRVGHIVIYNIYNDLSNLKANMPNMVQQKSAIQQEIKKAVENFTKDHKGRLPKDNELPVIQEYTEQLQQIELSIQKNELLTPLLKALKDATLHEGGITRYIDNSIQEDIMLGVVNQFSKAISIANNFSLGTRKTFDEGLENLAGSHPETLSAIKSLMDALTQLNAQS